ncbi:hypothetical protein BH09BAC4_BH09BAC4_27320 [soil metagenome]
MKTTIQNNYWLLILLCLVFCQCKKTPDSPTTPKSSAKSLTTPIIDGITSASATFDAISTTYTMTVPFNTDITALKVSFSLPTGATAKPASGSVQNFTNPVTYAVTAEDGSIQTYTIKVVLAAPPKSSEKQITEFKFTSLNPVVSATIDQTTRKITAQLPPNTNVASLVPLITVSAKATVSPGLGIAQNFTNPVNYTVVAEDGSSQVYQVSVDVRLVSSVPAELGLSNFYKKYIDASGIPILSSDKVSDAALIQVRNIVNQLIEKIPAVVAKMIQNKIRVAIMAESEVTTDIPEHSDLYTAFPGTDWNTRARGLGATLQRPACSCAEENLLCYPSDRYLGEDILIHEFSHGIHQMGINFVDTNFDKELQNAYSEAISKGLWSNTYADDNYAEYWAEGVQDWFDVNKESIPSNGIHNQINTREELKVYDPKLYELISRYFNEPTKKVSCQVGK